MKYDYRWTPQDYGRVRLSIDAPPQVYYPQAPLPQYVPPPRRRPHYGLWALLIIAGTTVALLGVIALVTVLTPPKPMNDPIATSAQVAAVCQAGSYHKDGRDAPDWGVPGVTDEAWCTAQIAAITVPKGFNPNDRWGGIRIIQFSSLGAARDFAAIWGVLSAMTITTIDGKTVLFGAAGDPAGVSLQPLAQFGFTITPAQG